MIVGRHLGYYGSTGETAGISQTTRLSCQRATAENGRKFPAFQFSDFLINIFSKSQKFETHTITTRARRAGQQPTTRHDLLFSEAGFDGVDA